MSKKSNHIARLIQDCAGQRWDAHYLGFFECFNRGLYFEAHDVLEELWLSDRDGPNYSYFKGLIQLAGAFVHLQKERLRPAVALFDLASANLAKYPDAHEDVDLTRIRKLIAEWRRRVVDGDFQVNPLKDLPPPRLEMPSSR